MTKNDDESFNVGRAELFEAMGHPNRIRILKALSDRPLGFSELKRTLSMESSGLLSFHLQKLTNLVKTTAEGAYALTDEGKEALRIAETLRNGSSEDGGKRLTRALKRDSARSDRQDRANPDVCGRHSRVDSDKCDCRSLQQQRRV